MLAALIQCPSESVQKKLMHNNVFDAAAAAVVAANVSKCNTPVLVLGL